MEAFFNWALAITLVAFVGLVLWVLWPAMTKKREAEPRYGPPVQPAEPLPPLDEDFHDKSEKKAGRS